MKNLLLLALLSLTVAASADSLLSGASAATSSAFSPAGSFWNGTSQDVVNGSNQANVGNFLNDTGAFALNGNVTAGCPTCGVNYMASGGQMYVNSGNTPDFVSNLNFSGVSGPLTISLLYANNPANSLTTFGIYDASSSSSTNHLVLQNPGTNLNGAIGTTYTTGELFAGATDLGAYNLANGSPYADWGLYVTTCEDAAATSDTQCAAEGQLVTFFMGKPSDLGSAFTPADTAHQHFALFQAGTNPDQFYAGVEESTFTAANPTIPTEGYGDYNDLIFGIHSSATSTTSPVPEPATLFTAVLGLGGLALFEMRRRRSII
jgi:MYXO-CTERM domain-containing protein